MNETLLAILAALVSALIYTVRAERIRSDKLLELDRAQMREHLGVLKTLLAEENTAHERIVKSLEAVTGRLEGVEQRIDALVAQQATTLELTRELVSAVRAVASRTQ